MNILFLTQIVPFPPDAGPKVKSYHVLRALVEQGHSITLVSFVRPEESRYLTALEKLCNAVYAVPMQRSRLADVGYLLRSYLKNRPFLVERDDLRAMQTLVDGLVQDGGFDFIHADQLTMVQFALRSPAPRRNEKKPKIIFDAHNAVWTVVERMQKNALWFLKPFLTIETKRLKRYEGELTKTVDHILAVTDIDRSYLEDALHFSDPGDDQRRAPISIVPIAVDTRQLQPIRRKKDSRNIVTLGTLHYPPNADGIRWFMTEVFPLVRDRVPEATLTIIGKNPPSDFLVAQARDPESIRVAGYVPELTPYLEDSALMVVPVRAGGGMRVRILEAFAYGMPVVTTSIGLEGIQANSGAQVFVADSAVDFAACTAALLQNSALREKFSVNGRRLAETSYDWRVALTALSQVYGT